MPVITVKISCSDELAIPFHVFATTIAKAMAMMTIAISLARLPVKYFSTVALPPRISALPTKISFTKPARKVTAINPSRSGAHFRRSRRDSLYPS